jgi:hypothetical protein
MKQREGWEWKETATGGYWSKVSGTKHSHKLDFFCPHCKRPTGTICDKYLHKYGICANCYVLFVADRQTPAIDLSKYKK